jgi:uncharacterized membrane protein YeaQ/YmgE (transglycosylase-associated protein family)
MSGQYYTDAPLPSALAYFCWTLRQQLFQYANLEKIDDALDAGKTCSRNRQRQSPQIRFNREETVMNMSGESLLVILLIGAIAGWLAGQIVQGTGYGLIGDIIIGIIGAFIASLLFPSLGIHLGAGIVAEIIAATIGAVILLVVMRLVRRGGRW